MPLGLIMGLVIFAGLTLLVGGFLYKKNCYEEERSTFCFVLAAILLIAGALGLLHATKEDYATNFEEGYYQINVNEAIASGNEDIDSFALTLKNKNIDTIKIEKNKGKVMTEFICIVETPDKDLTFYLDPYDIKELVELEIITTK